MTMTDDNTPVYVDSAGTDPVQAIHVAIADLNEKLDRQIELLNIIVDNVKPALDALADSPLGNLFGMNK